ncbi:unnamed protein product [Blepharisma stoltei]|uniref:NADP-dependent oxidoreductase domain-containing protein n=1 Tax=Blepharisma stoltei TaxID=1481888 RepID=A0AAU9JU06_9CILI|nr:unnamed protein product [Blepharisma stoltei]
MIFRRRNFWHKYPSHWFLKQIDKMIIIFIAMSLETMEYRKLGTSGLKVSALSYGYLTTTFENDHELHKNLLDRCVRAGINFIDTSEFYGNGNSETILGENLKEIDHDRDDLIISTKLHPTALGSIQGLTRKRIVLGLNNSLQRLQLDYVDVLSLHRFDYEVPLKEQIAAINQLIETEKVFYWGSSMFTPQQLAQCYAICEKYGYLYPIVEQCEYSMLQRQMVEVDYTPLFDEFKLGTAVWGPLAGGLLSGKYNDGNIPSDSRFGKYQHPILDTQWKKLVGWRKNNGSELFLELKKISEDLGCTQSQLALAWVLRNPDVSTALFGAKTLAQIEDNLGALSVIKNLNKSTLDRIEEVLDNKPATAINYRTFTPSPPRI